MYTNQCDCTFVARSFTMKCESPELKSDTHGSPIKCGSPQQFYPPCVCRLHIQTQSKAPINLNLKPSPKI